MISIQSFEEREFSNYPNNRDISFLNIVFALSNYVVPSEFFAPFYYHFRRNVSNIKSTGSIGKNVHLVAKQFSKKYISGLSREIFILSCIQFGNKIESFKDFDLKSSMWGDYRTEMMTRHVDKMPNEVCRLIGICVILSYFFWQRTPCAEQLYYTFKN